MLGWNNRSESGRHSEYHGEPDQKVSEKRNGEAQHEEHRHRDSDPDEQSRIHARLTRGIHSQARNAQDRRKSAQQCWRQTITNGCREPE